MNTCRAHLSQENWTLLTLSNSTGRVLTTRARQACLRSNSHCLVALFCQFYGVGCVWFFFTFLKKQTKILNLNLWEKSKSPKQNINIYFLNLYCTDNDLKWELKILKMQWVCSKCLAQIDAVDTYVLSIQHPLFSEENPLFLGTVLPSIPSCY